MSHRRGPKSIERWLPLGYFFAALTLVAVALPSVLRQVPPEQNQTAELSPDAPPDDEQQSIIASLNRGVTGTAGDGSGEGEGLETGVAALPVKLAPRACPRGFGNPPRQIESPYGPPCATVFKGNNGGATYQGVTANEIRVGLGGLFSTNQPSYEGAIRTTADASETAVDRTFRVYQEWINQNFQFYGRRLQFYATKGGAAESEQRTRAAKMDEEYGVIGSLSTNTFFLDEMIRRKLFSYGSYQVNRSYYAANFPYASSFQMDGDQIIDFTAELVCKQLVGKAVSFTDDPLLVDQPRVFGAMVYSDIIHIGFEGMLRDSLREQCGQELKTVVNFNVQTEATGADNKSSELATAVSRMRFDGVTSIICICDFISPIALTSSASSQSYYPEWINAGTGYTDANLTTKLYDQDQWAHAISMTANEIERADAEQYWYRAYKEIDPGNTPHANMSRALWDSLLQIAAGIQQAGPTLTPETFTNGLLKLPRRVPEPRWAVAGGYGPGDYTYADYVAVGWWDRNGEDPASPNAPGAYRYLNNGQRYGHGQIPSEPLPFFKEGISRPTDDDVIRN